jgi:hypothetical protein
MSTLQYEASMPLMDNRQNSVDCLVSRDIGKTRALWSGFAEEPQSTGLAFA